MMRLEVLLSLLSVTSCLCLDKNPEDYSLKPKEIFFLS